MKYPLYHNELCPDLWDGNEMKPTVRDGLLRIAKDFVEEYLKEHEISLKVEDVVVIGSATNYNWTPFSDIDLHVVVDFSQLDMSKEDAEILMNAVKANWNKTHNIKVKGHDVEIYVQGLTEKPTTESSFSVMSNEWIKAPTKHAPEFNKEQIKKKHQTLKTQIEEFLKSGDEKGLKRILERLYAIRQAGLDANGEFSTENIVFKILRAQGYLDKIKDAAVKLYDKEVSVDESIPREMSINEAFRNLKKVLDSL